MTWKDRLRPASFNNIPFYVEDHELEVGRRLVVNEYPFRDEPYTEDMGASARRYNITAYLVGNNYMDDRDSLMDAVESGTVGSLVHPYYGTKEVICQSLRIRENKTEGGYAVLAFTFVQAGQRLYPEDSPVAADLVSQEADELISAVSAEFLAGMVVSDVSEWVRDAYGVSLTEISDIFSTIRVNGGINKQTTTALINQAAIWVADIADLSLPSVSLISDVQSVIDKLVSSMAGVFDLAPNSQTAVNNLIRFSDYTADRTTAATSQGDIANNNAMLTENFIRTVAVATEAKSIVKVNFATYEDAVKGRENILDRIDALAGQTTDDTVYNSLRSVRAQVAAAVPGEDNDLPRIVGVVNKESLPSLAMSYEIYGDVEQESDIIARNNIRHPAFLPGGSNLNVLEYAEDRT